MLWKRVAISLSSPFLILSRISSKSFINASSDLSNTHNEKLLEIIKLILLENCKESSLRFIEPSVLNLEIKLFKIIFNFSCKLTSSDM